jgi:hypothetical protein
MAERRARRSERHAADADAHRAWVDAQAALGQIDLKVDEDLMLLIGRRTPKGVDVIAPVPADDLFTGVALARARRAG